MRELGDVRILTFGKLKLGQTDDVLQELQKIPQIEEIYLITGQFDIAFMIKADEEEIHEIFSKQIDKIDGITESYSNLLMKKIH